MEQRLSTGYLRIELSPECFAQLPPGFCSDVIPDDYIFNPEWNRARINRYWRMKLKEGKS